MDRAEREQDLSPGLSKLLNMLQERCGQSGEGAGSFSWTVLTTSPPTPKGGQSAYNSQLMKGRCGGSLVSRQTVEGERSLV